MSAPKYFATQDASSRPRIGLAVESMRRHTTDEGWQLFQALEEGMYGILGYNIPAPSLVPPGEAIAAGITDVVEILDYYNPSVVVIQDKREWIGRTAGGPRGFDDRERYRNVEALRERPDIFKVAILKDAHNDGELNREFAEEIGCHAWICYYDLDTVARLAPFVRKKHLIRTYHTVDSKLIPRFDAYLRSGCLLSGAAGPAYPLRSRLIQNYHKLPETEWLPHPGYHRNGCLTPMFLDKLSHFKVAICTASRYQYLLRKIIEATACGCVVITNLNEYAPGIEPNLWRVGASSSVEEITEVVQVTIDEYDAENQRELASVAQKVYDYRTEGVRLAGAIEAMRKSYNDTIPPDQS